jgi:hypothetical protein
MSWPNPDAAIGDPSTNSGRCSFGVSAGLEQNVGARQIPDLVARGVQRPVRGVLGRRKVPPGV